MAERRPPSELDLYYEAPVDQLAVLVLIDVAADVFPSVCRDRHPQPHNAKPCTLHFRLITACADCPKTRY
ncbi:hypothetical protein GGE12_004370 [Rhizobium mongolense]|uniref:Uncharacterized protein n=1 Tax=Rhizobium mongolense TaxID=57676 RepID=A0A7W6RRG6_9HYPH|nr:hypothetical protein [Rhizobium mongolense]